MQQQTSAAAGLAPMRARAAASLVLLTLVGTGLRFWAFSRLGLVHFDEGVYALSGFWSLLSPAQAHLYGKLALFAPPAFVVLVGWAYRLFGGASDLAAILPSVLFGSATIVLVWWSARRWFGVQAGIAAAAFLALSQYHIALSRMALTDVLFGFFFLLALVWIALTFETARFRWAILSGLAIGAAWNTKYHGWLPAAIAFLPLAGLTATGRLDPARQKRLWMCWLTLCVVAALCYLPWALHVHSQPGGYFALMRYQRTFLNRHWIQNTVRQATMQWYLDGWLSRASAIVAFALVLLLHSKWRPWQGRKVWLAAFVFAACAAALGGTGTATFLALLFVPVLWRQGTFGSWLLLAAMAVLFLSTPLYRPYARLLLPLMICIYIAAGACLYWLLGGEEGEPKYWGRTLSGSGLLWISACSVLTGVLCIVFGLWPAPRTWMPTDSVRRAANQMMNALPAQGTVLVHGGPEIAFYFARAGLRVIPIDDPLGDPQVASLLRAEEQPYFLVTTIYSAREPRSRKSLPQLASRLHLFGVYPIEVNDVRLLDDFTSRKAWEFRRNPTSEYELHLYRVELAGIVSNGP